MKANIIESNNNNTNNNNNCNLTSKPFERKRTANLESLIGNLKVRKMNQNGNHTQSSLYVEVTNSISDCSRSTPPLSSSSPSVSPSSISPDSPIQSNVSSNLSSISSSSLATGSNNSSLLNMNKSRSLLPKFRWMVESSNLEGEQVQKKNQNNTEEEIEEIDNEEELEEEDDDEDEESLSQKSNNQSLKINQNKNKITNNQKLNAKSKAEANFKPSTINNTSNNKNDSDPSRAVKFYDDFIDFRGDILRRPPNSKNCRILWEYLFLLLQDNNYSNVIKWEDQSKMVFRIVQAEKLAALWGLQKNRLGMTYEKLSRGMRYYYPNNIIAREPGRRLLYRFMRHPDEIKKFVKKNGTYMLKKAKINAKKDANPDDSGVDEPINKPIKEEIEEEFVEGEETEQKDTDTKKNGDYSSLLKLNQNNNLNTNNLAQSNQFYTDFYQYMYSAQMAAAAMGLPSHAYFSKLFTNTSSNSDDMSAAQYLMQLRNSSDFDINSNQIEALKNLANSLQNTLNNNNNNKNNIDLFLKSKRISPKSNSTYSSSSSTHSLESEPQTSNKSLVLNEQYGPLNLSINDNDKNKKRKNKYEDN